MSRINLEQDIKSHIFNTFWCCCSCWDMTGLYSRKPSSCHRMCTEHIPASGGACPARFTLFLLPAPPQQKCLQWLGLVLSRSCLVHSRWPAAAWPSIAPSLPNSCWGGKSSTSFFGRQHRGPFIAPSCSDSAGTEDLLCSTCTDLQEPVDAGYGEGSRRRPHHDAHSSRGWGIQPVWHGADWQPSSCFDWPLHLCGLGWFHPGWIPNTPTPTLCLRGFIRPSSLNLHWRCASPPPLPHLLSLCHSRLTPDSRGEAGLLRGREMPAGSRDKIDILLRMYLRGMQQSHIVSIKVGGQHFKVPGPNLERWGSPATTLLVARLRATMATLMVI